MDTKTHLMIAGTGFITVVPFILFAMALDHLKLATVGIIQYVSPTLQFLQAVLLYGELFTRVHMVVFACIWTALALYTWEIYRADKVPARP